MLWQPLAPKSTATARAAEAAHPAFGVGRIRLPHPLLGQAVTGACLALLTLHSFGAPICQYVCGLHFPGAFHGSSLAQHFMPRVRQAAHHGRFIGRGCQDFQRQTWKRAVCLQALCQWEANVLSCCLLPLATSQRSWPAATGWVSHLLKVPCQILQFYLPFLRATAPSNCLSAQLYAVCPQGIWEVTPS